MINMKDVARSANVSIATVSHVINGTRYVSEETQAKVYEAMKSLSYTPNSVARSLRSRKSKIIGLLVPMLPEDTSNHFFMSVAQGIEKVLMENGYNLLLSNTMENIRHEQEQIRMFNSQLIDGLIMAPTYEDHAYLGDVLTGEYPVVFIDRKPGKHHGDCILADGTRGTYEAVELLLAKGHTRIGFITGTLGLTTSDERLTGYKLALQAYGIPVDESLIGISDTALSSFDSGSRLTGRLVEEQHVTALLVANNVMTMGALDYLQSHGIGIPDRIALIGFDDYEWAKVTRPALTVVKQPSFELGEKAAETLLRRIEQPSEEWEEIRLPTKLIIRNSV